MFEYRLLETKLRIAERHRDAEQSRLAARTRRSALRRNERVHRAPDLRIATAR
jgi:hypothetical protein